MRRKPLAGLLALPLLAVTACGSGPASTGHGTASRSASPSTSVRPSPTATLPTGLVLGPTGLGALHFGMTGEQAMATGLLANPAPRRPDDNRCTQYPLVGGTVRDAFALVSPDRGVVMIEAPRAVRTPEHVGAGSTLAQVRAAYPGLSTAANSSMAAPVPGNAAAQYRFSFDKGTALAVAMTKNLDCAD
ncbi:MAG TPA: hypothetical protein VGN37_07385 [Actinocatenispora sp.]